MTNLKLILERLKEMTPEEARKATEGILDKNKTNYYFVSKENHDDKILYPRVPKNRIKCEDSITPRICVSQSINGCLTAIEPHSVGEVLYVHECESDDVIQPTLDQVPDRCFTGETWITAPTKMTLFMKIITTGCIDSEFDTMHNAVYNFKQIDFD